MPIFEDEEQGGGGGGDVVASGTLVNNELVLGSGGTTIKTTPDVTYDGSIFKIAADLHISGLAGISILNGLMAQNSGNHKTRNWHAVATGSSADFYLVSISTGGPGGEQGGVVGTVDFATDWINSSTFPILHYAFWTLAGNVRGYWWFEHTNQGTNPGSRVYLQLINVGGGGTVFELWLRLEGYSLPFIRATTRFVTNITDSGPLVAGTIPAGPVLYSTLNTPTSSMNIGNLTAGATVIDSLKVGTTGNVPSALVNLESTTQGLKLSSMTTTQRDNISSPSTILIYNNTTNTIDYFDGLIWKSLGAGGGDSGDTNPFGGFGTTENNIRQSENMSSEDSYWYEETTTNEIIVTPDNALDPKGDLTADTVEWQVGGLGASLQQDNAVLPSTVYNVSFWARSVSGNNILNITLGDGTGADVTIGATLQRHELTLTSGAENWIDLTVSNTVGIFEFWGFQISEGNELLVYARTDDIPQPRTQGAIANGVFSGLNNVKARDLIEAPDAIINDEIVFNIPGSEFKAKLVWANGNQRLSVIAGISDSSAGTELIRFDPNGITMQLSIASGQQIMLAGIKNFSGPDIFGQLNVSDALLVPDIHHGSLTLKLTSASPQQVQLDTGVFETGMSFECIQTGTGGVEIIEGAGFTINSLVGSNPFINGQYGKIKVTFTSATTATVSGDIDFSRVFYIALPGTSLTLDASHAGKCIYTNSQLNTTITIPTNVFKIGDRIEVLALAAISAIESVDFVGSGGLVILSKVGNSPSLDTLGKKAMIEFVNAPVACVITGDV